MIKGLKIVTEQQMKTETMTHDQIIACIQNYYNFLNREIIYISSLEYEDEIEELLLNEHKISYEEAMGAYKKLFSKVLSEEFI